MYCMYVQEFLFLQVLHVCVGIAGICMYVTISRYCMYQQVLKVCAGMSLCIGIACMCRYRRYVHVCQYRQVLSVCEGIVGISRYVTMCRYVSVCVGIQILLIQKYLQIHTDTYIYIQYLHIVTYLRIPAIPTHTGNTYTQ